MKRVNIDTKRLVTSFEKDIDKNCPWSDYPRPQMVRNSYICLNGEWKLVSQIKKSKIESSVLVPFPPQSKLSGTDDSFNDATNFTYIREFNIEESFVKDIVLLHFGAVDQVAKIFINDSEVGEHAGGYLPFEFDITDYVNIGKNVLRVEVKDDLNSDYPYGKQRKKRGGMWYTPISGIWQTVWIESVPKNYIKKINVTSTLDTVKIEVIGGENEKNIVLDDKEYNFDGDSFEINIENPVLWTPENPYLYNFTLNSGEDTIVSYFALRTISIVKNGKYSYIALNDKPYFFHGVLDQGYYSDGIYLPATSDGYKYDILTMKKLGFNMLRKHIKIEPDIFYYYCDLYGMVVFQDFVNSGKYNFIFDTALPTAFLKWGVIHYASKKRRTLFLECAEKTVELLRNHPSVCYYTIFNEGWGQFSADKIYTKMKKLDISRIWDTTSGWFKTFKSDVDSEHIYFKRIKIKGRIKRPLVLSEFGGYSYKLNNHSYNLDKNYGYRFFKDKKSFEDGISKLYLNEIIPAINNGLCASVLTQLSDVEDETNGLLTYDRAETKIDENTMRDISYEIFDAFDKSLC